MRHPILLFFLSLPGLALCQMDSVGKDNYQAERLLTSEVTLQTGVGYNESFFVDLGVAYLKRGRVGHHPFQAAAYVANETYIGQSLFIAPKIGVWVAGGSSILGIGASLLYYTDFNEGRLAFRPEIGFGSGAFRLYYGYTIRFGDTGFDQFNKSAFGINVWLKRRFRLT